MSESTKRRLIAAVRLTVLTAVFVAVATSNAGAARAGENPQNVSVQFRQGSQGIEAVLTWTGISDTTASYEIYRRTPIDDRAHQGASLYATILSAARRPDGTFQFIDLQPMSLPDKPCYSIGPSIGGEPSHSETPQLCLPTFPGAPMARLAIAANPGPNTNTWYLTGTSFAAGSDVVFKEGSSRDTVCSEGKPAGPAVQATFDGYAFALVHLGTAELPRTLAACQPGWLPEQLTQPPVLALPATQPGVGLGYPLATRTGIAEVDRALMAIQQGSDSLLAVLHPHDATTNAGEKVVGVPAWQCGEFVSRDSLNQQATEAMPPTSALYAVYRVNPDTAPWQLFRGADYAIVLAYPGMLDPVGAVAAVSPDGIVGFGWSCGSLPSFFVRANAGFVIAPPTEPTGFTIAVPAPFAPGTGNSLAPSRPEAPVAVALVGSASMVLAAFWFARSRQWRR